MMINRSEKFRKNKCVHAIRYFGIYWIQELVEECIVYLV